MTLLRQFNALPEGVKFLVDRRAELLGIAGQDAALRGLADDLRDLLANWFDIGFLELRRITWESPAALLEKLIAYEAVHEIRGWTDLKNRLEADRRCFAFFHPRMPDEPLIFVEVALVSGIAGNIHALLDEEAPIGNPQTADAAIFYSISNCQKGLVGISFGDFLIKRVADALTAELPRLKTFATLSPLPGFRAWLAAEAEREGVLLAARRGRCALSMPMTTKSAPTGCCSTCWSGPTGIRTRASPRPCASRCCGCARAICCRPARRPAALSIRWRISISATAPASSG